MKKVLCVLLAFCMLFSAGCGKKKTAGSSGLQPDGSFVPNKDLKLTVWTTFSTDYVPEKQPDENVVEDWLVNKTRVKIDNVFGNRGGQWESMLAQLIAGNNFPDLVHCGAGQGAAHFARIAQADRIWELTPEMLKTYAPDIWEKVPAEMWERIKVDGKIYGIPYQFPVSRDISSEVTEEMEDCWTIPSADVGTNFWIRDDILKMLYPDAMDYDEAVALLEEKNAPIGDYLCDVPINTTEDFVNLMKKIQDLNLTVGNKKVYPFGYVGSDCWTSLALLGGEMMGYRGHFYTSSWDPVNKRIRLPILEPIVKVAAKLQVQMIRDNLIDPESLVHTDAQYKEKVLNGQYAIASLSSIEHPPFINAELEKNGASFRYRPLYTMVKPAKGYELCEEPKLWGASVGILKKVSEEDIPQILNWMNVQFTDEYEQVRYWGPAEAGLYEDKEDGKRVFKDDRFNQRFIYHKGTAALPDEETKGLNQTNEGLFSIRFMNESKWDPMFYNGIRTYELVPISGAKFASGGTHAIKPIESPPFQAWAPEFANIDEVKKYWSSRSQWEEPFRVALAAKSDAEFEQKWKNATDNLRSLIDVDKMLDEMTEAATKGE